VQRRLCPDSNQHDSLLNNSIKHSAVANAKLAENFARWKEGANWPSSEPFDRLSVQGMCEALAAVDARLARI
jgi:hypothetical protein